ncbi:MAG: Aldehyde dehydrogenase [uncultured Acidimicrobiales bacterium]|uniref:Aldehyde dehydrogenase n=1 Tax=uncultured Acidimicrobiales bacterium TaxID=310071 RepID=A0A6J4HES9_9ACTN|nr:MAG: Aldehyde dehydrogenase [uncultured Acidimicrobiales bacterium]
MDEVGSLIDGLQVWGEGSFDDVDPSTGRRLAEVTESGAQVVDQAVAAARRAFEAGPWRRMATRERGRVLRSMGEAILAQREDLAVLESRDTGKPLSQARNDVDVAARYFEFYGSSVEALHGDTIPATPDTLAYTTREPLGVTAHIVPWNYPLQIGSRSVAPSLAVGNACVLKPAEEAPLTLFRLATLALEAGLPAGVLNVVNGTGAETGAALAGHPGIDHVSFTGSVEVGSLVAAAAAANVVPVSLELGGKSPNIVFADADLERTVTFVARSVLQNAGQTCSAGSRLLVHRSVHDDVVSAVVNAFGKVRIGPGVEDPDLGPLISDRQVERLQASLRDGLGSASLRQGGRRVGDPALAGGFFFEPTVVDRVDPESALFQQELFGPVLSVSPFEGEAEAVALANGTEYGLIAAVWTGDVGRAHRVAGALRCGQVYVNTYGAGGGVELPFGGMKKSGYGREKGFEALLGFCQTKTVAVHLG